MTTVHPPRLAVWLLKKFGRGSDNDAILGDLAERFRAGKTAAWYWKQAVVAIAVTGRNEIHGHRMFGIFLGALVGGVSIAGSIVKYDNHGSSASPYGYEMFIAPIVVFFVARHWLALGLGTAEIRSAVRRVGHFAAPIFGASYYSFVLWQVSIDPLDLLTVRGIFPWTLAIIPTLSGFTMFYLMRASSYIAILRPAASSDRD